jgi:hypothetical protein
MGYKLPYNSMPNLGDLQEGDIVPVLRPPFAEGTATMTDLQKYVRPYKVYVALLTQSGTDAPTVIVLENTIGNIVWAIDTNGIYTGTLTGQFTSNKTFLNIANSSAVSDGILYSIDYLDSDRIYVSTYNIISTEYQNDLLTNTSIEIRVYYSEPA